MILPIIIGFFCAMMWVGLAMNTQSNVVVESRHDAWSERGNGGGGSLNFAHDNFTAKTMSSPVKFMPWSKSLPPARASHTVMTGAWDFRQVDLNSQPSFKTFGKLLASTDQAAVSAWQSIADGLPDIRDQLQQQISEAEASWTKPEFGNLESMAQQAVNRATSDITGAITSITEKIAEFEKDIAKNPTNALDLKKKVSALKKVLEKAGDAIDAVGDL